jgi:hypothetical protein
VDVAYAVQSLKPIHKLTWEVCHGEKVKERKEHPVEIKVLLYAEKSMQQPVCVRHPMPLRLELPLQGEEMKSAGLSKLRTALAVLGFFGAAMASGDGSAGQHLRKTLKNGSHTAEVEVDHSKVTIHLKKDSGEVPQSVLLTFYDKDNRATTLELKTLASPSSDDPGISTYAGSLSSAQQSFVGIELRIPFTKSAPETLRLGSTE